MQHKEWCGPRFGENANRIFIVGYSHHGADDHENYTTEAIDLVLANDTSMMMYPFFNRPHRYLGDTVAKETFWNSVIFLNFLPRVIGDGAKRYDWGSQEDHAEGLQRLQRLVTEHKASHVFVLTPKPNDIYYKPNRIIDLPGMITQDPVTVDGRSYDRSVLYCEHGTVKFAYLPHPQRARTAHMQAVFRIQLGLTET